MSQSRQCPVQMTAEDERIFARRIERLEFVWAYEDVDRSDAEYMLALMRERIRFDLAPISVRIGG